MDATPRIRILGPVEVGDGRVNEPKERAALAVLALAPGAPVAVQRLVAGLWGDDPPRTSVKTLQGLVSRLRHSLGDGLVAAVDGGYALLVDPDTVDVHRFEILVGEGRAALAARDGGLAATAFRTALGLWRGEPLTDLSDGAVRDGQRARLDELHMLAVEGEVEAALLTGKHEEAIPTLEALVAEHPLRESLWSLLLVALYRCDRQADALRAYRRLAAHLAEELGIDPSPPLQRLEARILRQDPQLDLDAPDPPSNLPAPLSSFIGRSGEVERVVEALRRHRLVTLVGPGGIGKTRLGVEVGRGVAGHHPDGVWWVDLQLERDDTSVAERVARTLGLRTTPEAAVDAIAVFLRHRELLLILDNCEHVLDAVTRLAGRLLTDAAGLHILATSRQPLQLDGERRLTVPPLALPPIRPSVRSDDLASEAVQLYLERCADHGAPAPSVEEWPAVVALCRRLDGVPLAIELAAARTPHLSPQEIGDRLERSLDVLAAPHRSTERHRTLVATIQWSHDLLDEEDRSLFDRLSVFPGDFDVAAALDVASAPGLEREAVLDVLVRLADASMVQVSSGHPRRYRMLEALRTYGSGRLSSADHEERCLRHAHHYRELARQAGPHVGPDSESLESEQWRHRLVSEHHNLRQAMAWSLRHDPRAVSLEFARALSWVEFMSGRFQSCIQLATDFLDGADSAPPELRAWPLLHLGYATVYVGDLDGAEAATREAADLFAVLGDAAGHGWALWNLGLVAELRSGSVDDALPSYRQAVAVLEAADRPISAARLHVLTCRQLVLADRVSDDLVRELDEAEAVLRAANDPDLSSADVARLELAQAGGDPSAVEAASWTMLRDCRSGERNDELAYVGLARARWLLNDIDGARRLLVRAVLRMLERGDVLSLGVAVQSLAAVASALGRPLECARLWGAGTAFTPVWPLLRRLNGEALERARSQLGDRFSSEESVGRRLSLDEIADLAAFDPALPDVA